MTIIKKTYDLSLHIMAKQLSTLTLNTKKKTLQTFAHKDLLSIYGNHKRQPEGFKIKN